MTQTGWTCSMLKANTSKEQTLNIFMQRNIVIITHSKTLFWNQWPPVDFTVYCKSHITWSKYPCYKGITHLFLLKYPYRSNTLLNADWLKAHTDTCSFPSDCTQILLVYIVLFFIKDLQSSQGLWKQQLLN